LFCIFLLFYFVLQKRIAKAGQLLAAYLLCTGAERFLVDFWRADREYFTFDHTHLFSSHQYIALSLILAGIMLLKNLKHAPPYDSYSR
ncbi:prolipoprotein diacylglyceryl transferase family protein, partial [Methylicorpusculum sp.]|uniref:prolipoprotein diacylglyceryl transferase family protein n=1 Tax=Methylicorpusculum sp. TaxID=2713644 RepID=UPI002ABA9115